VIAFRRVELFQGLKLCNERVSPEALALQPPNDTLGGFLLFGIMVEDDRSVLSTSVRALPIQSGRVVEREEDLQQPPVRDDVGIEMNLDCLGVSCGT